MTKRTASSAIETITLWEDAGYDCDHCGGRILRRTDRETGLRDRSPTRRSCSTSTTTTPSISLVFIVLSLFMLTSS